MKLQLWQQFSSNHSSSFTVIGEFPTPTAAKQAARKVRAVLKKIADWHRGQEAAFRQGTAPHEGSLSSVDEPSPPEQEIAAQYQITWREEAIEWFDYVQVSIQFDRFVFLIPQEQLETDGQPFDRLMERLGGKGYHQGYIYERITGRVLLDLTCNAHDEATAEAVYTEYLGFQQRIYRIDRHLRFDRWEYPLTEFPRLVDDLRQRACSDIKFSLTQLDLNDEDDRLYGDADFDVMLDILKLAKYKDDRRRAAELLGKIGDARAFELLIAALSDEDDWLRRNVVVALGEIQDVRAVDALHNLLQDTKMQDVVIIALGKLRDIRSIELLTNMLNHSDLWELAAQALGAFGTPMREPVQKMLLTATPEMKPRLEKILEYIYETEVGSKTLPDLRSSDEKRWQSAWEEVKQIRDLETMLLYFLNPGKSGNIQLRDAVASELIAFDDPRIVPAIIKYIPSVGKRAIYPLVRMGAKAVPELITLVETHSEAWILDGALAALAEIGDASAYNTLIKALSSDRRDTIEHAARGLGNIGDQRAIQPLVDAYFRGGDKWQPSHDSTIIDAIFKLEGQNHLVQSLLARLDTQDWRVTIIILLLGKIGDTCAISPLRKLLVNMENASLQKHIQAALDKLEGKTDSS